MDVAGTVSHVVSQRVNVLLSLSEDFKILAWLSDYIKGKSGW